MGVHYHPSYMRFLCGLGGPQRAGRGVHHERGMLSDASLLRKWYGLDCLAILGSECMPCPATASVTSGRWSGRCGSRPIFLISTEVQLADA